MTTAEAAARLNALTGRKYTDKHVARLCKRGAVAATWNAYARRWEVAQAEIERYAAAGTRLPIGRPRIDDDVLMDEAVSIEIGDTALTEWMTDADAAYIQGIIAEAKARGLWDRVQELAATFREA